MPMELNIRPARADDADVLVEFNCAMARETEEKELVPAVVSAGVRSLLADRSLGHYLVAEAHGRVVGSLMLTTEWSDWRNGIYWWIQSVYVRPECRRQGVYRRLYEHVKAHAAEAANVRGFRLYVERDNAAARRAYRRLGMDETYYVMYEQSCQTPPPGPREGPA